VTSQSQTLRHDLYTLDAAGNLSSDGLRQFSYDAANRLSSVQVGQSSGGGSEASKITYLHNSAGQRVFKSEPQVAQLAPNSSTLGSSSGTDVPYEIACGQYRPRALSPKY
jgi:hypothetical protein